MISTVRRIYSIITTLLVFPALALPAYADNVACPQSGQQGFDFSVLCKLGFVGSGGQFSTGHLIGNLITLLLIAAIIIALFFLIIGGIRWITSGGDKSKLDSARSHIVAAIVGLIIALLAYLIINIILTIFGVGNGLSNFNLPKINTQ